MFTLGAYGTSKLLLEETPPESARNAQDHLEQQHDGRKLAVRHERRLIDGVRDEQDYGARIRAVA